MDVLRRCLAACFAAGMLCSTPARPDDELANLRLVQQSVRDRTVLRRASYNYAPAIIRDGALYHLYWCGGVKGDFILHAQATELDGPWHGAADPAPFSFDVALEPTQSAADFDGLHTCDPNVIKLQSRYYLYYGGEAADGALTAIGVAASTDAIHFERLNHGAPIVTAAKTNPAFLEHHLTYGAGQPAVTFVRPFVYLSFTDSTGAGANPGNGAGQFALRSRDPTFASGIEELTAAGWQPRQPGVHTAEFAFVESFGLDWAYDAESDALIAVSDRTAGQSSVLELEPRTLRPRGAADLALNWKEGPGLVAEADKSLPRRQTCRSFDVSVFAAQGKSASPWSWNALAYSRATFDIGRPCPN